MISWTLQICIFYILIVNGEIEETLIKNSKYDNLENNFNELQSDHFVKNEQTSKISVNNDQDRTFTNSWFLNVPLLPVVVATSKSIPEGSCKKQLQLYLSNLNNGTLWATEMFDSSAKYPYGILEGFTRHLGIFDQCLRIHVTTPSEREEIRGRYCLVDIKYQEKDEPKNVTGDLDIFFDPHGSAWEAIREKGDVRRYERYRLQMALCVPASCSRNDIVSALKEPLGKFASRYNLKVETSIHKDFCHAAHEAPKLSKQTFVFCFISLLIITLVVISTILDDEEKIQSLGRELLHCFSARRNLKSIFTVNYKHSGFDSLPTLRVAFSTIAAVGHRHIQLIHVSNVTARFFEMTMTSRIYTMILHNGSIIVDAFFGFGGLVLSYQLLEYLENSSKKCNALLLIIKRFLRLQPLFMYVTFAYAVLLYHLGSGPFWENRFGFDRDSCSNYWWTNLLLISNYYNERNMCIFQSWYIVVDFHCFIIGVFLILQFQKMTRKMGYTLLGIFLIVSTAIPFYISYKNDLDPFFIGLGKQRRLEDYKYFTDFYIKTHMRLPAYFVGLIMGAFLYDYKFATWRLSKFWSRLLIILQVVFLSLLIQNLGYNFVDPNVKTSSFLKALYASLHRPIFSFSICSVILLLTIGDGLDFHYNFATPAWVQPIAKLSYGYFLLHFAIQSYDVGRARAAFTFTFYDFIRYTIIDSIYTLILSLFFVVIIEEPFKNLGNLIFMGRSASRSIKESKKTD